MITFEAEPANAVTGLMTIEAGVVPVCVLQVRVAADGVAVNKLPVASKLPEPTVSATVKAKRVEPCRLNTEASIEIGTSFCLGFTTAAPIADRFCRLFV